MVVARAVAAARVDAAEAVVAVVRVRARAPGRAAARVPVRARSLVAKADVARMVARRARAARARVVPVVVAAEAVADVAAVRAASAPHRRALALAEQSSRGAPRSHHGFRDMRASIPGKRETSVNSMRGALCRAT